jgi:hypothetical protein
LIVSAHVLAKHLAAFEIFPLIQTVKLCWPWQKEKKTPIKFGHDQGGAIFRQWQQVSHFISFSNKSPLKLLDSRDAIERQHKLCKMYKKSFSRQQEHSRSI